MRTLLQKKNRKMMLYCIYFCFRVKINWIVLVFSRFWPVYCVWKRQMAETVHSKKKTIIKQIRQKWKRNEQKHRFVLMCMNNFHRDIFRSMLNKKKTHPANISNCVCILCWMVLQCVKKYKTSERKIHIACAAGNAASRAIHFP